jgi:hypothetical protein
MEDIGARCDERYQWHLPLRRTLCFCSVLLSLAITSRYLSRDMSAEVSTVTLPIAFVRGVRELSNVLHVNAHQQSNTSLDWTASIDISRKIETVDFCHSQWTHEKLIGRCWGLTTSTDHPSIKGTVDDKLILDAKECKQICCKLGSKCITWQYWASTQICKIGRHVRLGPEGGGSPRWCEPAPPRAWEGGRRNLYLNPFNQTLPMKSECQWASQQPGQCFGLGPERTNSTGGKLSAKRCAEGCCNDSNCWLWQHLPDRGCYFNTDKLKEAPFCDQYVGEYTGGRKKVNSHTKEVLPH